jgi:hypothetical protein
VSQRNEFIKKEKRLMQIKIDQLIGQENTKRRYYKQKEM